MDLAGPIFPPTLQVCKLSGDLATAGDLIERALYAFEAAFHPSFRLASGRCRLNYSIYENRAFFLAVYRCGNGKAEQPGI